MPQLHDRLEPLFFLPPATGVPWTCAPVQADAISIERKNGAPILLNSPLFWYDPPWHAIDAESADVIAEAVARLGIVVSALRRDVSGLETPASFHTNHYAGGTHSDSTVACELQPLPRMVPYRPERYGLGESDFDGAKIIDVRLAVARDATGRFAYSPEQIKRWESTSDDHPLAGGGWVPAATFPPDVPALERLHSKLNQLRVLSPKAAVFVSISPYRLDQDLPAVIQQKPDGVILRADDVQLTGLALAAMTRRARQWMKQENVPLMPLWVVPGKVSADEAVKLIALGASGVAIDHWCNPIIEVADEATDQSKAARMGFKSIRSTRSQVMVELVNLHLDGPIRRFDGLLHSIAQTPIDQQLATLDAGWSKSIGVRHLSFGVKT